MSRFGGVRSSADDLAYGEEPPRWDRERFERARRAPEFREDYRYTERDTPGRQEVRVQDRVETRGPRGRFEEKDRFFEERERFAPPGRPRRTDRELFGEQDPREIAEMALAPYRRKSVTHREMRDQPPPTRRPAPPRPGMIRRQSSLDTFDRKPLPRYAPLDIDEYRIPPGVPVPLPIRRGIPSRFREEEFEEISYPREDYREVEISREREVIRRPSGAKSEARSIAPSQSISNRSSVESFEEISRHTSPSPEPSKIGKKGKTRMPKRLVRKEAIMDLGYPFEEEDDFIIVKRALEKEQIDEVIKISESYKTPGKTVYRFEEKIEESEPLPPPPPPMGHMEYNRTEWINPPSVAASRSRSAHTVRPSAPTSRLPSPSGASAVTRRTAISPTRTERTARSHRSSRPARTEIVEEHEEEHFVEERAPSHAGTIVIGERDRRSNRDIQAEIRGLEAEQRALRLERDAEEKRELAVRVRDRSDEEFQLVEYRDRPRREVLEIVERDRSPKRDTVRVEKDRKARTNAKLVAAAMATLT